MMGIGGASMSGLALILKEKDPEDINSAMLVEAMKKRGVNAVYTPGFEDAAKLIREGVREGVLVITMGCGDIYKLNDMLTEK